MTFNSQVRGVALVVLATTSMAAHAWGGDGHRVIALLAERQLIPEARKEVARLLALEPGETLASVSTWADEHRSPQTAAWHYVNFPRDSCTYDAQRDCPDGKCVVEAINWQTEVLLSNATDEKRLTALKYLVHLAGDVHQPLHAGYLDDKGGNTYQLQAFMRGSNLHALWDTGLIKSLEEDPTVIANRLAAKTTANHNSDWKPAQAAAESCRIVGTIGFYPERRVGGDYIQRYLPVVEQRLQMAGKRLADLLNGVRP